MNRRLVLLRHAKSAWPDVPDDQRPLAPRGRRDAPEAGAWLRNSAYPPDLVLCSPARRASDTWRLAAAELDAVPDVRYDPRLYQADVTGLLRVIRRTPDDVGTLLIVGHEPSMRDLALHLAGVGDGDALDRVRVKFPTAAIAVLAIPGRWADLGTGRARLSEFVIPRG